MRASRCTLTASFKHGFCASKQEHCHEQWMQLCCLLMVMNALLKNRIATQENLAVNKPQSYFGLLPGQWMSSFFLHNLLTPLHGFHLFQPTTTTSHNRNCYWLHHILPLRFGTFSCMVVGNLLHLWYLQEEETSRDVWDWVFRSGLNYRSLHISCPCPVCSIWRVFQMSE